MTTPTLRLGISWCLLGDDVRFERHTLKELKQQYVRAFMPALAVKATVRKQVNVLQHILGYFKEHLLVLPRTLLNVLVARFNITSMQDQLYLNPHPKELMLRNHGENRLACDGFDWGHRKDKALVEY